MRSTCTWSPTNAPARASPDAGRAACSRRRRTVVAWALAAVGPAAAVRTAALCRRARQPAHGPHALPRPDGRGRARRRALARRSSARSSAACSQLPFRPAGRTSPSPSPQNALGDRRSWSLVAVGVSSVVDLARAAHDRGGPRAGRGGRADAVARRSAGQGRRAGALLEQLRETFGARGGVSLLRRTARAAGPGDATASAGEPPESPKECTSRACRSTTDHARACVGGALSPEQVTVRGAGRQCSSLLERERLRAEASAAHAAARARHHPDRAAGRRLPRPAHPADSIKAAVDALTSPVVDRRRRPAGAARPTSRSRPTGCSRSSTTCST